MIETLQARYGFTVMPFTAAIPARPCPAPPRTKKPSPGSAG